MSRGAARRFAFACAAAACLAATASAAAAPPKGFALRTIVRGLDEPTAFAWAPDGRIYIAQKKGMVRVFHHGVLEDFLDLRKEVNEHAERGLVNIALDPRFARNRTLYLLYTAELRPDDPDELHPGNGTLVSVRVSKSDPDRPETGSRRTILSGFRVIGPWHAVAGMTFDARGRLLVGFGDGSPYYPKDFSAAALWTYDLGVLNGKIVRIDPATGKGVPGNPFYDPVRPSAVRSKVIAYGFRNPFSIRYDQPTERFYVGDVGTDQWEEIDVLDEPSVRAGIGLDFGWPCYEGGDGEAVQQTAYATLPACHELYRRAAAGQERTVAPMYAYGGQGGAAIVVGPVYRGTAYPQRYRGRLFFADFVKDRLWTLDDGKASDFGGAGGWGAPVDIQATPRGSLAYLAFGTGRLNEIVYVGGEGGGVGGLVWGLVAGGVTLALTMAGWLAHRRHAARARPSG